MTHGNALVLAHVATFFMGIAAVLATVAGFAPWNTTFYRVSLGGLALLLLWLLRGAKGLPPAKAILGYLGLGVLLSIHWFAFFHSFELLGVMLGSAVIGLEPLLIALAARLLLAEKLPGRYLISLFISMAGFGLLAWQGYSASEAQLAGLAWAVFAFAIFALLVVFNRSGVARTSARMIAMLEMLGAIPLSMWLADRPLVPSTPSGWFFVLALGLLCTGLAYSFYNASMKVLTAPVAGLLLSLEVVYGMVGGWLIGDRLTAIEWLAALLISNVLLIDLISFWRNRNLKTPAQGEPLSP